MDCLANGHRKQPLQNCDVQKKLSQYFGMKFHLIHLAKRKQERIICKSESVTIFYRTATCNKNFLD